MARCPAVIKVGSINYRDCTYFISAKCHYFRFLILELDVLVFYIVLTIDVFLSLIMACFRNIVMYIGLIARFFLE